jgi:organic hydroperoxide reductase OsmC/OhrA
MSLHRAAVVWERGEAPFTYDAYSRNHRIRFGTGEELAASAAAEYKGDARLPNPEEELVAALSTCHMLTFLALCARKGLTVERYEDAAEGTLAKNAEGRLAVTTCVLRPLVRFAAPVDEATLAELHAQAHRGCFIAASVKTAVTVEAPAGHHSA